MLVVLDDFYMIDRRNQPLVLDHLHGITKRTPVWLKIASVKSRTQTFVNGDPPLGMQPPGDVHPMSLDIGLEKFPSAKTFLEEVAEGVLTPHGFDLSKVLTAAARERAVLVAGGAVCRDYFDVLIAAADVAWNTAQAADPPKSQFRIDAENIHAAAGELFDRKLTELRADAGLDAPAVEARFEDLLKFVRDRDTFFLLVRRDELELDWGREVQQLEDLRFLHRIMTTRPNTGAWRGVDTVVYMVDIPALVKNGCERHRSSSGDQERSTSCVGRPGSMTPTGSRSRRRSADVMSSPTSTSSHLKSTAERVEHLTQKTTGAACRS